jgi:Bacterial capsule synthesis protein PGA_cap
MQAFGGVRRGPPAVDTLVHDLPSGHAVNRGAGIVRSKLDSSRLGLVAVAGALMAACAAPMCGTSSQDCALRTASQSLSGARLIFLGDTSFGENYQQQLAASGRENVLASRGYDHMIANFATILDGASLVVANLETPITKLRLSPLTGRKRYIHYGDATETPHYLAKYGVGLVSLANNHTMDFGAAGLAETAASLARHGLGTCGAGENSTRARRPHRHETKLRATVFRVALLCAFEFSATNHREFGFYAGETPGVNALLVREVAAQVDALRREDTRVYVVAFPHWGRNYKGITANQRRLGRRRG